MLVGSVAVSGLTAVSLCDEFLSGGDGWSDVSWGPGDGGVCLTEEEAEIYLGYSGITFSSAAPTNSSISPTGGSLGSSGTITANGQNLAPFVGYAGTSTSTAAITGSGISVSVASATLNEATLNYTIQPNASTGAQDLTLTTDFGTSNAATFTIGDPTPTISSVTPPTWNAGSTNASFTINGTGFGTSPTVTITGTGLTNTITGTSDTQINGTFTIDPNAPNGQATIEVQSSGYGGSGFLQSTPGQPSQNQPAYNVPVNAAPVQILWGTNCSTATSIPSTSPVVGQLITLVACVGTPPVAAASPNWQLPQGMQVTAGFQVLSVRALNDQAKDLGAPQANQDSLVFYFVGSGAATVTFNNGPSVNFVVSGPTTPTVTTDPNQASPGYTGIWPNQPSGQILAFAGMPAPQQVGQGLDGIILQAAAQPPSAPSGTYSWVQVLNQDTIQVITPTGRADRSPTSAGPFVPPTLDHTYPYTSQFTVNTTNDLAVDAPQLPLCQYWGEAARLFSATMYLLWTPSSGANGCSGAACTIPVPLGNVSWQWAGDATNTLSPLVAGWNLNPPGCANPQQGSNYLPQFVPDSTYPTWSGMQPTNFDIACP